ncbi:MAG: hypothetical protein JNM63_20190, partial [Spirochaetia bacterium]|nr:hypothetical protein [Spirochaetia bacterium]
PAYGARPLVRVIQREIGNFVAEAFLAGRVKADETIKLDWDGDKIVQGRMGEQRA